MSAKENESTVRRIYEDLWNERRLEVADEVVHANAVRTQRDEGQRADDHSGLP